MGTIAGATTTSSAFMAVQGTGAMAMVVADVPSGHDAADPGRALFTLAVVTGVVMILVGLLRLDSVLRFVPNAVMVGFISAVGVNIILGQLDNFTGYEAEGANRVIRAFDTLIHIGRLHLPTLVIGATTVALIVLFERTRLRSLGLVVAVIVTSGAVVVLGWDGVASLNDLEELPSSLPTSQLPMLGLVPVLIIPALSLAFVGLVQGAAISASFPNPDGRLPTASRDFVGQGAPGHAGRRLGVGLVTEQGRQRPVSPGSRFAGLVMAVVILVFGEAVGYVSMPALAGLLMLIGVRTVKPRAFRSVWLVGSVQKAVLVVTFALTMLIPLQYAVLVGVGLSVVPPRRPAVESGHDQTLAARPRGARRRNRPAGAGPG